jgi:hypothetical protein
MKRRVAVTLIEALMAIFVMAIGLLALLTLFPLGAVQMAQALKDDRTAQTGINAIALFKGGDLGNDPSVNSTLFETGNGQGLPTLASGITTSYPVFVDPVGISNGASANVGGAAPGIPRVSVTRVPATLGLNTPAWANRWFTMPDDHTYADNGVPDLASVGNPLPTLPAPNYTGQNTMAREGRYSFAYMVRRQTSMFPSPPVTPGSAPVPPINLAVVVYSGRSPGTAFNGAPLGETLFTATFGPPPDNSPNIIRIDWTGLPTRPGVRRGSWVLDARMLPLPTVAPTVATGNVPQGYFYRVVNVIDFSATVMDLEVQRPIGGSLSGAIQSPGGTGGILRGPSGPIAGSNPVAYYTGPLVLMDAISEVFEKDTSY